MNSTSTCNDELIISRSESPWRGYTGSYDEEQAGLHVQAVKLQPEWEVPKHLAAYAIAGKPLLAIDRASRRVRVDERCFSDLERIDVTRLAKGERKVIGKVFGPATQLSPARLVDFLLRAQLVVTYWHLGAKLCRVTESTKERLYRASWKGTHEYCTNGCHKESFAFVVEVSAASGEITLQGH